MGKKIVLKSSPYIIKSKEFSTIDFEFIFQSKYEKKYLFYLNLLRQVLLNSNFLYKNEKSFKEAYDKNMLINLKMRSHIYNDNLFIRFGVTLIDPKVVKDYDFESAFKFFIDTMFNPNIVDGAFDIVAFERERDFLKNDILESFKNVYNKTYQKFLNIVDDNGVLKENIYNNMDLIDSANPKEMYEIYKKLIYNNKPMIVVYGNVDKSINELISKYYKFDYSKIVFQKNDSNFLVPFDKPKDIVEDSEFNQSALYVAYKVKNMNEDDKFYITLVNDIIGKGVESLIFKKLRVEEGLVYNSSNWSSSKAGLLVVEAYINNNSKDKVIEIIKESFNSLKDKEFLCNRISRLKENIFYTMIREKDSKYTKMIDFIANKIDFIDTSSSMLKKYENIDIDYLIQFIDRLVLDTIYFSRGEFCE